MTIGQWFSFRGRIGRKTFWLGYVLPIFVASIVANTLDLALGLAPEVTADAMPADAMPMAPISGLVSLLSLWPMLAGSIKRLHDRNRSGWWIGAFYLVSAVVGVIAFVMLAGVLAGLYEMRRDGVAPEMAPAAILVLVAGGLVVFGFAMWLFIETGFLRGTLGPNRFGPDPLGGGGRAAVAARCAAAGLAAAATAAGLAAAAMAAPAAAGLAGTAAGLAAAAGAGGAAAWL
jgi:uncharacterized membrane protein YhaH (DUF805 family)